MKIYPVIGKRIIKKLVCLFSIIILTCCLSACICFQINFGKEYKKDGVKSSLAFPEGLRRVALLPVFFDTKMDKRFDEKILQAELYEFVYKTLREKGFKVIRAKEIGRVLDIPFSNINKEDKTVLSKKPETLKIRPSHQKEVHPEYLSPSCGIQGPAQEKWRLAAEISGLPFFGP